MKILLPVDGSAFTEKTLKYVVKQPDLGGPNHQYVLLNIVAPLLPQAAGLLGKHAVDEYYRETAREALDAAEKFLKNTGLNYTSSYKVGYVGELLPEEADGGGFDMVIMGTHGHGLFGNLVLGSVANAVLSRSSVPVLLIR